MDSHQESHFCPSRSLENRLCGEPVFAMSATTHGFGTREQVQEIGVEQYSIREGKRDWSMIFRWFHKVFRRQGKEHKGVHKCPEGHFTMKEKWVFHYRLDVRKIPRLLTSSKSMNSLHHFIISSEFTNCVIKHSLKKLLTKFPNQKGIKSHCCV